MTENTNDLRDAIKNYWLAFDGDILAYRIAAGFEGTFKEAVFKALDEKINTIANDLGVYKYKIFLSDITAKLHRSKDTNYFIYKGNRASIIRPEFLVDAKEHLVKNHGAILLEGFEADDCIATALHKYKAVHVGIDKDIKQVSGYHYDYRDEKKELVFVSELEAQKNLEKQILTGDRSDNVPGLPGIGDRKAEKLLDEYPNAEAAYEGCLSATRLDWREYYAKNKSCIEMVKNLTYKVKPLMTATNNFGFGAI